MPNASLWENTEGVLFIHSTNRLLQSKDSDIEIKYTTYDNVTKAHVTDLEDKAVMDHHKNTGYIPDGNGAHANKHNLPQEGKYPLDLKKAKASRKFGRR